MALMSAGSNVAITGYVMTGSTAAATAVTYWPVVLTIGVVGGIISFFHPPFIAVTVEMIIPWTAQGQEISSDGGHLSINDPHMDNYVDYVI